MIHFHTLDLQREEEYEIDVDYTTASIPSMITYSLQCEEKYEIDAHSIATIPSMITFSADIPSSLSSPRESESTTTTKRGHKSLSQLHQLDNDDSTSLMSCFNDVPLRPTAGHLLSSSSRGRFSTSCSSTYSPNETKLSSLYPLTDDNGQQFVYSNNTSICTTISSVTMMSS